MGRGRHIDGQLGEIELRIDIVSLGGRRQAGEDSCRPTTPRIAHEKAVLPVQDHALHLALPHVVVDRHRAVR